MVPGLRGSCLTLSTDRQVLTAQNASREIGSRYAIALVRVGAVVPGLRGSCPILSKQTGHHGLDGFVRISLGAHSATSPDAGYR